MKTAIITLTLALALAATAHAAQKEVKGYWTNGNEYIPVFRCVNDTECERLNPHIPENIKTTHIFVPAKKEEK